MDLQHLEKIRETSSELRKQKLTFFEVEHLLVYLFDEHLELVLISLLSLVEFDKPLLESQYDILDESVVFGLLLPRGKPAIYTHKVCYLLYKSIVGWNN